MTIAAAASKTHWNYFLALEKDLEVVSRYVEFHETNYKVFSIELAHLLFAASSEVDVVAKLICEQIEPNAPRGNINEYKSVLLRALPELPETEVFAARYGLTFKPWSNWQGQSNPLWWKSYNNVKHERDTFFHEATLKNAMNALAALLILVFHFYSRSLATEGNVVLTPKETTGKLHPNSTLFHLRSEWYSSYLMLG